MTEIAFAFVGSAVVLLVAIPLATLVAKLALCLRRHSTDSELTRHGSSSGYAWVIAPVLVPLLWAISAAVHQSEPGRAGLVCLDEHSFQAVCLGAFGLAVVLGSVFTAATARSAWVGVWRPGSPSLRLCPKSKQQWRRIDRLAARSTDVSRLGSRLALVDDPRVRARVRGILRPKVELGVRFLESLDDDMLEAVVLHEIEHLRCGDPLRGALAEAALSTNPFGFLLRPEFDRWRFAREVACDRHAVASGASATALAHALVVGARPTREGDGDALPYAANLLGRASLLGLELRVRLLLDPEGGPCRCGSRRGVLQALLLLSVVVCLPHAVTAEPLDSLHRALDGVAHPTRSR